MFRFASLAALAFTTALSAFSATVDFSGTWVFNPDESKKIGPMSSMTLTTVIQQSASVIVQKIDATMMGQREQQEVTFDLSGKTSPNETPMGEKSETATKWEGSRLVTTWRTPGAVAGTTRVSTETRYLSPDGKKMHVESSSGNGKAPVIMTYDKK